FGSQPCRAKSNSPARIRNLGTMASRSSTLPMKWLDQLYFSFTSNTDRGTKFERFPQSFLQTDPVWSEQFEKIWMWDQWPDRWGHDTGIDLVGERRDGGKTAIQCKFYDPQHRVSKADIDTFLAASGRGGFTERIVVST